MGDTNLHAVRYTGYDLVRTLLGIVLLTAALLKAWQLATGPVAGDGLLGSRWSLALMVALELVFGLWLLAGIAPRATWLVALTCFSCFAVVSFAKALAGHTSCGCFGRVPVNPWYTVVLHLAAVSALIRWQPYQRRLSFTARRLSSAAAIMGVTAALLAVGIPAGLALRSHSTETLAEMGGGLGNKRTVLLEPEKWVGKGFPLFDYIDIGSELEFGEWIVVLYREQCPSCQEAVARYEALARDLAGAPGAPRVALVEVAPSHGDSRLPGSACVLGRLRNVTQWIIAPLRGASQSHALWACSFTPFVNAYVPVMDE